VRVFLVCRSRMLVIVPGGSAGARAIVVLTAQCIPGGQQQPVLQLSRPLQYGPPAAGEHQCVFAGPSPFGLHCAPCVLCVCASPRRARCFPFACLPLVYTGRGAWCLVHQVVGRWPWLVLVIIAVSSRHAGCSSLHVFRGCTEDEGAGCLEYHQVVGGWHWLVLVQMPPPVRMSTSQRCSPTTWYTRGKQPVAPLFVSPGRLPGALLCM
jgi:hypothetical protein